MGEVSTIGLDVAKSIFQVHGEFAISVLDPRAAGLHPYGLAASPKTSPGWLKAAGDFSCGERRHTLPLGLDN